jgi:hypothetical protein
MRACVRACVQVWTPKERQLAEEAIKMYGERDKHRERVAAAVVVVIVCVL